jgi:hypothetical protein
LQALDTALKRRFVTHCGAGGININMGHIVSVAL